MKLLSAASVARGLLFGVLEAELVGTFFVDDPFVFVPGPAVHEVVEPVGAGSPADGDEGYGFSSPGSKRMAVVEEMFKRIP